MAAPVPEIHGADNKYYDAKTEKNTSPQDILILELRITYRTKHAVA
jgi:hypothetical protein